MRLGRCLFVADFVASGLPGVVHHPPEGTYLAWLDCAALDLELSTFRFFLERMKRALRSLSGGDPGSGPSPAHGDVANGALYPVSPMASTTALVGMTSPMLRSMSSRKAMCMI